VDAFILIFLTSALVSGQLHELAALPPGKRVPITHCIVGWVGTKTVWNMEKRTFLILPRLKLQPLGRLAHSQSPNLGTILTLPFGS
jgi:hypothetical protein